MDTGGFGIPIIMRQMNGGLFNHSVHLSSPGPKRRYERAFGDLGDAALACKVDYTLRKARGLKECKLQVNNMCQPCEHSAKHSGALRREGLLRYPYNGAPC
jgi:hypothetical protein